MPLHALLVDDDEGIVTAVEALAKQRGLQVESARTWDDGVAKFNALSPDLVIADYNLPGSVHGLRLLFDISKVRPSVRLILISAYLNEEDVHRVEQLGVVSRVLRKVDPIATARTLLEEIQRSADSTDDPSDWVSFASAAGRARIASQGLDELDALLKTRLPGS